MAQLIYRGSVKDVFQKNTTELIFSFTDRYSIFDWGEMPDHIPGKGVATAKLTSYFYKELSKQGIIETHFLNEGPGKNEITVKKFLVPPRENYEAYYQGRPSEAFLPLEVLYRWGVPEGSSLLKRGNYTVGQKFSEPMIEFSTKLEPQDRLISKEEARQLAGLNESEMEKLISVSKKIATFLKKNIEPKGIEFWDGKVEFAFVPGSGKDRDFVLVDSIGLDEVRLTKNGLLLSKEILRQKYKNSVWFEKLNQAKAKSKDHFKEICEAKPEPLSKKTIEFVAELYDTATAVISGESSDLQALDRVLKDLK